MKSKLTLCIVATLLVFLFACAPATKQVSVEVSCDDFYKQAAISKEVAVAVGDSFTVTLCSNPTTGFEWESAHISDQTVLKQVDHEFIPPEDLGDRPPPPGSPGEEVWTFKAFKKGTSTISIEYSRPWEGGEKGAWKFDLTVTVK